MSARRALLAAGLACSLGCALARDARAEDVDGSYGRVEGDLLFDGTVGCAFTDGAAALETHVALSYLSTAGGYVRYVEAFGQEAPFARLLGVGLELRPLFLGRYALDLERGPAHLDLFLDSFALVAGATWAADVTNRWDGRPGLELGASIEVPFVGSASGPYVGVLGLARFGPAELAKESDAGLVERGSMLVLTLSWHQVFDAGLVDLRDPPRLP